MGLDLIGEQVEWWQQTKSIMWFFFVWR
jgi:hypothetical protein